MRPYFKNLNYLFLTISGYFFAIQPTIKKAFSLLEIKIQIYYPYYENPYFVIIQSDSVLVDLLSKIWNHSSISNVKIFI